MIGYDMKQVDVAVYDKVREYYRIDKKLGGLIKTFVSVRVWKLGRDIQIFIPQLEREDAIEINGMEYVPKTKPKSGE